MAVPEIERKCPKCGGYCTKTYQDKVDMLRFECEGCGFYWLENPLDKTTEG